MTRWFGSPSGLARDGPPGRLGYNGAMPRYEILPHPADGKFRAYGRTLAEAFENAALATASLMWDWTTVQPRIAVSVRVSGQDREQLLVKFLNELVYLFETRDFVLAAAEDVRIATRDGAWTLEAVFRGDDLAAGYEVYGLVKAATYNEMEIAENGGFVLQVVVDM